jgi:hypothetical protein
VSAAVKALSSLVETSLRDTGLGAAAPDCWAVAGNATAAVAAPSARIKLLTTKASIEIALPAIRVSGDDRQVNRAGATPSLRVAKRAMVAPGS